MLVYFLPYLLNIAQMSKKPPDKRIQQGNYGIVTDDNYVGDCQSLDEGEEIQI